MKTALPSLFAAVVVSTVAVTAGCTANSWCAKRAECEASENDRDLEADSTAVCVEEFNGFIGALRANEEDDCQKLADATLALRACEASLKCDDFFEADRGGECDDQLDDFNDASEDINGLECTAQD